MLLIGAKGHAREVLDVLDQCGKLSGISFFDDISTDLPERLYGKFRVIRTINAAAKELKRDKRFVLALGAPKLRHKMALKFSNIGGVLTSVISPLSRVGNFEVQLGRGLNLMTGAFVGNNVIIGEGTLLNANSTVHHDSVIGSYCEISPGAHVTGRCRIGDFCSIGTGAVILPDIRLGRNVIVGAGAVVNRNIPDGTCVAGVPARALVAKR